MTDLFIRFYEDQRQRFVLVVKFVIREANKFFSGNFRPLAFENSDVPGMMKMVIGEPTWSPTWLEVGKLLEVMRFVDYVNSWNSNQRSKYKQLLPSDWTPIEEVIDAPWFDWRGRDSTMVRRHDYPSDPKEDQIYGRMLGEEKKMSSYSRTSLKNERE